MNNYRYVNKQLPLMNIDEGVIVPLFRGYLDDEKTYFLRYEIEGLEKVYEYSAIGSDLLEAYKWHKLITIKSGIVTDVDLAMREEANLILELIAWKKISPEGYKKVINKLPIKKRAFIESADQKDIFFKEKYLFSKLCMDVISNNEMKNCNLIKITDIPFSDEYRNYYKDNWMLQPVTEHLGFESFNDFCEYMQDGFLKTTCEYRNLNNH